MVKYINFYLKGEIGVVLHRRYVILTLYLCIPIHNERCTKTPQADHNE